MTEETKTTATPAPDLESLGAENLEFEAFELSRQTGQAPSSDASSSAAPAAAPPGDEPAAKTAGESETPDDKRQEPEPADKPGDGKKGGVQKRIDQLTREKRELEARLALLEAKPPAAAADKPAGDKPADKAAEAGPAPDGKPKTEDFDTYEEFVEKLTDWKAEQREKRRAEQTRQSEVREAARAAQETWNANEAAAVAAHRDYHQVLEGAQFNCSQDEYGRFAAVVHDFERGPDLLYHLAAHPEDLDRIVHLGAIRMASELGKIEASLPAPDKPASQTKSASEPTPKLTGAPKPVAAVTGGKGAAVASLDDPNLPYQDFERRREEQLLARRR